MIDRLPPVESEPGITFELKPALLALGVGCMAGGGKREHNHVIRCVASRLQMIACLHVYRQATENRGVYAHLPEGCRVQGTRLHI
jgi:hypothetical protein